MTPTPKVSRRAKLAVSLLLLAICVISTWKYFSSRPERARRHWKNDAIPAIASWADERNWQVQEIAVLTKGTNDPRVIEPGWLTDKMILMKSGEWLVYKSHCSKEEPHIVRDIFLAKGSDGKWYYSTVHFCVGLCVLRMEETQPASLAAFVHEYNLREFDGHSDESLQMTKSLPASWGENTNANTP